MSFDHDLTHMVLLTKMCDTRVTLMRPLVLSAELLLTAELILTAEAAEMGEDAFLLE